MRHTPLPPPLPYGSRHHHYTNRHHHNTPLPPAISQPSPPSRHTTPLPPPLLLQPPTPQPLSTIYTILHYRHPQPPLTPATTAGTTTTASAFPAVVAAVAGCGRQKGRHRRVVDWFDLFVEEGLSAAKPPSGWRPDDGTATTAAPCGVGLVVVIPDY
nr:hypothetical protein [Tanacetum cinerariifolium]